ncbi:MAG: glycosyl hydrolase family 65 protein [candidate division WOR-3 bacterium]|nr:glycosyl hydrolase family 65 protein [candidate division WOR-3 bacterium]
MLKLSDKSWCITQEEYKPEKTQFYETLFTLANGYTGVRANLVWETQYGHPVTFFAGVFDRTLEVKTSLANAPDWTNLKLTADNETISFEKGKLLEYKRTLDMRRGILHERIRWESPKRKITRIETVRLVHLEEKHEGLVYGRLMPENYSGNIIMEGGINGYVFSSTGFTNQLKNKHFELVKREEAGHSIYLEMKTHGSSIIVGETTNISLNTTYRQDVKYDRDYISNVLTFHAEMGKEYEFCKYATFYTSRDTKDVRKSALDKLEEIVVRGYREIESTHGLAWRKKWENVSIEIEGDELAQKSLRFNLFHLIQCANPEDEKVSIGAKGLHGEGYWGHAFWDTEIYMLPFFIYTDPATAKALLMYRYNTLDGARKNAKLSGFGGAQFAWQSADEGTEVCPKELGSPFGKTITIHIPEEEHHVVADVAYGVEHYYKATQDREFLLHYGLEILVETARFWASRVRFDKKRKRYIIERVIGPDEIHEHCNNEAYTNFMAKWNLKTTADYAKEFKASDVVKKLKVTSNEVERWHEIADKILILYDEKSGIYEQFEGYFNLKEIKLEPSRKGFPEIPSEWRDWGKLQRTKVIKQPDVVLLHYLLGDRFSIIEKKRNFDFYEPYTAYRSSLGPSVSSIVASEIGYPDIAYQHFLKSARIDLDDFHGNTASGFHAASAGGTWQAVVNGFAGMHIQGGHLYFDPHLPKKWQRLKFGIRWRGKGIIVEITHKTLTAWTKDGEEVEIGVRGSMKKITGEKRRYPYIRHSSN